MKMASLRKMVGTFRDELRDGIAEVIFWKEGRSWNAEAFWLNGDCFESEDLDRVEEILTADPNAIIVNGYTTCPFSTGDEDSGASKIDFMMDHIRQRYEQHLCQLADFCASSKPDPVKSADQEENSVVKFEIGKEYTCPGLYGGEWKIRVVDRKGDKIFYTFDEKTSDDRDIQSGTIIMQKHWVMDHDLNTIAQVDVESLIAWEYSGNGVVDIDYAYYWAMDVTALFSRAELNAFLHHVPTEPTVEDKQEICKKLIPVLQLTRNLYDVVDLTFDPKTELVTATFSSGFTKKANVAMDSGTSMIRDIIGQIT